MFVNSITAAHIYICPSKKYTIANRPQTFTAPKFTALTIGNSLFPVHNSQHWKCKKERKKERSHTKTRSRVHVSIMDEDYHGSNIKSSISQ